MVVTINNCRRFEANIFSKIRCQNCYKPKEVHSPEALETAKMSRKVTACRFLYVAPPNVDFSQPSHSAKRWQRRCFTLFDDGELNYALDDNPETVPQVKMNMCYCARVCEADAITGHPHSIFIAFNQDENRKNIEGGHIPICYMKADTLEEIRWWQNLLTIYAKPNVLPLLPVRQYVSSQPSRVSDFSEECGPTVIHVTDSASRQSSPSSSRSSSAERKASDYSLAAKVDLGNKICAGDSHHGTPRSVKFRNKTNKEEPFRRAVMSDIAPDIDNPTSPPISPIPPPPLPESPCPIDSPRKAIESSISVPFTIDTSNAHTLRKGWLMLRGKNESDWIKHWVVLAGLSLKLYKDVWAEDSTDALLSIDLTECENVYPSASAKNYGIEIKCRKTRYILSAMTPGIRDSWIAALQQNLHNPSPTYAETCQSDAASLTETDIASLPPRKKNIAYVAPESHHSNSMMDEESGTDDELNSLRSREAPSRLHSGSERSLDSSSDEVDFETIGGRHVNSQRFLNERDPSLSPTVRRSPISRIKEKSSIRNQNSALKRHGSNSSLPMTPQVSRDEMANGNKGTTSRQSARKEQPASPQEMRLRALELQVQSLRDQLIETTNRLGETQNENERLKYLFMSSDARGLSQLRKSLSAAEEDIIKQQEEMESLRKQLSTPISEAEDSIDHDDKIIPLHSQEFYSRLVGLLKVQVGALSRFTHSTVNVTDMVQLRQSTDKLIRMVAAIKDVGGKSSDFDLLSTALDQITDAYQQLGALLSNRHPAKHNRHTNTDDYIEDGQSRSIAEIEELEQELKYVQASHAEEMETLKCCYEHQVKALRDRSEHEEHRRKKVQEELQTLNAMNENSMATVKKTHEEALSEQREHFKHELNVLRKEHAKELDLEKEATRLALESVKRSHEAEIKSLTEKLRDCDGVNCQASTSEDVGLKTYSVSQSKMIDQMSTKIAQLSALYSAKCLENSQLDEKLSSLLADMEKKDAPNDLEIQNHRLKREIRQKDAVIDDLRQRGTTLENKLANAKSQCSIQETKEVAEPRSRSSQRRRVSFRGSSFEGNHSISITSPITENNPISISTPDRVSSIDTTNSAHIKRSTNAKLLSPDVTKSDSISKNSLQKIDTMSIYKSNLKA